MIKPFDQVFFSFFGVRHTQLKVHTFFYSTLLISEKLRTLYKYHEMNRSYFYIGSGSIIDLYGECTYNSSAGQCPQLEQQAQVA